MPGPAVLPRAQPAPVGGPAQLGQEELGHRHGGRRPVGTARGRRRLGQRRAEHGVPLGEHLVVEPGRTRPARAANRSRRAASTSAGRSSGRARGPAQDGATLEVPLRRDPVPLGGHGGPRRPEDLGQLGRGPQVEAALLALGVGVLGRVQPPVRRRQRAEHVGHGLLHDLGVTRRPRDLPGVQVGAHQPGLVVQHLLEVRHRPRRVGGVAGEPPAQVVVDPPAAMASRVVVAMASDPGSPRRRWWRRHSSTSCGWGNLGADPKPPRAASKRDASSDAALSRSAAGAGAPVGAFAPGSTARWTRRSTASTSASAWRSTSWRRSCHASRTAPRTRRKLGSPLPSWGGK